MPNCIFYHHLCHWCSCSGDYLKKCADCRLVSYCSIEHQKKDWKIHKYLCKRISTLNSRMNFSLFNFPGSTLKEWTDHRTKVMYTIELLLNRKLEIFERQMLLFPNVCNVCYQYNAIFLPCTECHCTFYCSEEHMNTDKGNHKKKCKALKLCFDADLSFIKSVTCIEDIDYNILLKTKFPTSMDEFLEGSCDGNLKKSLASEELSFILSLIYGLLKCNRNEVFSLSALSVHILGCNQFENNLIKFSKIFFHWFPQMKLNLLLIGPDCDINSSNELLNNEYVLSKRLEIKRVKSLYHEYAYTDDFEYPNVVVAFNCGFGEFTSSSQDTWGETINCLMNFNNVTLIITSYTQDEAKNDISRIKNNSDRKETFEVVIYAEENPFRSLRPLRDWENHSVFYLNNFISVFYIDK